MNQPISWGKIAVLVVVIAGVAGLAFTIGKKSAVSDQGVIAPAMENPSVLHKPLSDGVSLSENISSIVDWSHIEFDACGQQAKYEKLSWWDNFSSQVGRVKYYNDSHIAAIVNSATENEYSNPKKIKYTYETYCQENPIDTICNLHAKEKKLLIDNFGPSGGGCLAKDGSAFIAVFPGGYIDGGNHIFRYDIRNDVLEEAKQVTRNPGESVNIFSVPREFLKREGTVIKMQGSGGDAGCGATSSYDFDLASNTVQEMRRCWACDGEKMECKNL